MILLRILLFKRKVEVQGRVERSIHLYRKPTNWARSGKERSDNDPQEMVDAGLGQNTSSTTTNLMGLSGHPSRELRRFMHEWSSVGKDVQCKGKVGMDGCTHPLVRNLSYHCSFRGEIQVLKKSLTWSIKLTSSAIVLGNLDVPKPLFLSKHLLG